MTNQGLRTAWVLLAVFGLPLAMAAVLFVFRGRLVAWQKRQRERPSLVGSFAWFFIILLIYFVLAISRPGSLLINMSGSIPNLCLFLPLSFVPFAFRRVRSEPCCAKCHYDVAQLVGPDGPPGPQCPECGHPLTGIFGTKTERMVISKPWLWVMVVATAPFLVVVGAFVTGNYLSLEAKLLKLCPTGSLIAHAGSAGGFTLHEWAELGTRTLSPSQREELGGRLLRRTGLQLHASSDDAKWLIAEFRAGRLSPEIARGMLRRFTSMRAPVAGEPSEIRLASDQAWGLDAAFGGWSLFVVHNGVRDASGAVVRAPSQTEYPLSVKKLASSVPGSDYDVRKSVNSLQAMGEFRVGDRTHVWVIAEPRARGAGAVLWKDGAPVAAGDAIVVEFQIGTP